jgi:hypothetical protein
MSAERSFQTIKTFFETKQAARQAMSALHEGVEIGIVIADTVECALFRRGDQPLVENRPAVRPDFVFHILPESIDLLNDKTKDEISDIGVNVIKEVLAGNIKIKAPGGVISILRRGYFEVVRHGGAPVASLLAAKGLESVPKILSVLNKIRSSK